ncbi:hypothetical protein BJX64DRAFT_257319 [Aspergillus heterothallicus]
MRVPTMVCTILVAVFAAVAVALPPHHESDTVDISSRTVFNFVADTILAAAFNSTDIEFDAPPRTGFTPGNNQKAVIGCEVNGFNKASKSGIQIGINQLKKNNGETTTKDHKCKWASCTAPGAAIWWCNYAGEDVTTTTGMIAWMAQQILDNCRASRKNGEDVVSGVFDQDNAWRVLVIEDKHLC